MQSKELQTSLLHGTVNTCFGCGPANHSGLHLKFKAEGEQVICHLRLAKRFAGPHGFCHGGIIATMLDEAMSKANRLHGVPAVTRHMEIEYLRPIPLQSRIVLTGRRVSHQGRKNFCEAVITNEEGEVMARGKALFIEVDREKFIGK